jgi:hypothetical protein
MMMKLKAVVSALVLLGTSTVASAQSCPTPYQGTITASGNPTFSGNTCTFNATTLSAICGNSDGILGTELDVIQWTTGPSPANPVTLSLQSADFTPELAVASGSCSANAPCPLDVTIAGPGTVTGSFNASANTTYYIFVTDLANGNCGAYNLGVPSTPVKLQNFSVK